MAVRVCPSCQDPNAPLARNRASKDGFGTYCRSCEAARHRKWSKENDEHVRELRRVKKTSWLGRAFENPLTRHGAMARILRERVLSAYGGACECCGETTPEFLAIDHIDGGGLQHRREIRRASLYPWLKQHGYPKDKFRLLCHNCNLARGFYGYCPHEVQKRKLEVA